MTKKSSFLNAGIFHPALNAALKRVRIRDGLTTFLNIREHCAWVHADRAAATMEAVRQDPAITFFSKAALRSLSGDVDHFNAVFMTGEQVRNVVAGAVVLSCGELESFPFPAGLASVSPDFSLASAKRSGGAGKGAVMDLAGLAERLRAKQPLPKSAAIFLDLAAEQGRLINALALAAAERLARSRRCRVLLFARHIRVAAWGLEALYRRAREAGVLIMRYPCRSCSATTPAPKSAALPATKSIWVCGRKDCSGTCNNP